VGVKPDKRTLLHGISPFLCTHSLPPYLARPDLIVMLIAHFVLKSPRSPLILLHHVFGAYAFLAINVRRSNTAVASIDFFKFFFPTPTFSCLLCFHPD
jgi:hypothetical protein